MGIIGYTVLDRSFDPYDRSCGRCSQRYGAHYTQGRVAVCANPEEYPDATKFAWDGNYRDKTGYIYGNKVHNLILEPNSAFKRRKLGGT